MVRVDLRQAGQIRARSFEAVNRERHELGDAADPYHRYRPRLDPTGFESRLPLQRMAILELLAAAARAWVFRFLRGPRRSVLPVETRGQQHSADREQHHRRELCA